MSFTISGKLASSCSSSDRETCWGCWYLLEPRKIINAFIPTKHSYWVADLQKQLFSLICGRGFGWSNGWSNGHDHGHEHGYYTYGSD